MDLNVPLEISLSLFYIPDVTQWRKWLKIVTHLSVTGPWWPWWNLPPTRDPLIFQIFGQSSNHHERVGTCWYQERFHSVVTSCRLSTLCCSVIISNGQCHGVENDRMVSKVTTSHKRINELKAGKSEANKLIERDLSFYFLSYLVKNLRIRI